MEAAEVEAPVAPAPFRIEIVEVVAVEDPTDRLEDSSASGAVSSCRLCLPLVAGMAWKAPGM